MIDGTCPNQECTNSNVGFEIDEESVYCPECGEKLVPCGTEETEETEETDA